MNSPVGSDRRVLAWWRHSRGTQTTTMTTVRLPDAPTYRTIELVSRLVGAERDPRLSLYSGLPAPRKSELTRACQAPFSRHRSAHRPCQSLLISSSVFDDEGWQIAVDQPRARPGRPRSQQSRAAVLRAASELIHEVGLRAMTTEEIAARSGASKATIYKWWPNKYAVAVEAFLSQMAVGSADPARGSAREDFRLALRGMVHFYTSESGRAYAQLVGEAQFDPQIGAELRDYLVGSRRKLVRAIWDRGVARGELRAEVDPEVAIDLIFGPAMYRLVAGHAPLDDASADAIVDAAMRGLGQ